MPTLHADELLVVLEVLDVVLEVLPGHWILTGQNSGNLKKAESLCEHLYNSIKTYKETYAYRKTTLITRQKSPIRTCKETYEDP